MFSRTKVYQYGETFRLSFMTSDFASAQKFKAVLNKRTISLCYLGSDGDLEILKAYLAGLDWQVKQGVKALGLHERDGSWVYVARDRAFSAGDEDVPDLVQLEKYAAIESSLIQHSPITADRMTALGQNLLRYNEPAKTVTVLTWCAGCFVKEMLRSAGIKYPHLLMIGEAGSGKSTTMERVVLPIFGRSKVVASPQVTSFTLMKEAASSNLYPQALDEFKPSKIEKLRLSVLYNHMRDSYDGHEGVRGRADQTQVSYELLAPLVVAGEESPDETAIRERAMELLFSKRDLKDASTRAAFARITEQQGDLTAMGRALLDTALTLRTDAVAAWHKEALPLFNPALPTRILNNLACCMVGLRLIEAMLARLGLAWGQIFSIGTDVCIAHLEYGVREYLLDGGESNKSVVELSLEVIDRMGLTCDECKTLPNGNIAIHFRGIYDRYTAYRRDHAIVGECLPYAQFMKQLRKSDLYVETKVIRFGDDTKKAVVLNYPLIRKRCDIEGFIHAQIEPLVG